MIEINFYTLIFNLMGYFRAQTQIWNSSIFRWYIIKCYWSYYIFDWIDWQNIYFFQSLHILTFLTASHNLSGIIYNQTAQRSEKQLLFIYCEYVIAVFYLDSLQFVLIIWLTINSHVKYLDKEEVHQRRRLLAPSSSHFESLNYFSTANIFSAAQWSTQW